MININFSNKLIERVESYDCKESLRDYLYCVLEDEEKEIEGLVVDSEENIDLRRVYSHAKKNHTGGDWESVD